MSDKQVTYYIGAGASANAVPMVSEIHQYYDLFYHFIKGKIGTKSDQFLVEIKAISQSLKDHSSPDTFAKKLFLQKEHRRSELLKIYLAMFLYWVEVVYRQPENLNDLDFKAKGGLDKRYDTFLATLLERDINDQIKLPPNINIVSWNYDSQIETAYSSFFLANSYTALKEMLGIFPKNNSIEYSKEISRIVKLNNYVHSAYFEKYLGPHGPVSHYNTVGLNFLIDRFEELLNKQASDDGIISISFAWETENTITQESLKEAKDIFTKTQILVIIGYSFPTFNRKVDKALFNLLPPDCTVYFQAPENVVHDLIGKLKSIKNLSYVQPITNLDQFHIPIEL